MIDVEAEEDPKLQVYTVRTVSTIKLQDEQTVTLKIRPKCYIRFQIDCGADCHVLPVLVYRAATGDQNLKEVSPSDTVWHVYGQMGISSVGKVKFQVWRGVSTCMLEWELIEGKHSHSVLGCKACIFLNVLEIKDNDRLHSVKEGNSRIHTTQICHHPVEKEDIKERYPGVFGDTAGKLNTSYKIQIDDSVVHVQHAPCWVPAVLCSRLQDELNRMEELGIIAKVVEPTDWVLPLVVVPKAENKLRICLDPHDLNKAIRREHYQLPIIEDIATRLLGT